MTSVATSGKGEAVGAALALMTTVHGSCVWKVFTIVIVNEGAGVKNSGVERLAVDAAALFFLVAAIDWGAVVGNEPKLAVPIDADLADSQLVRLLKAGVALFVAHASGGVTVLAGARLDVPAKDDVVAFPELEADGVAAVHHVGVGNGG